MQSLVRQQSLNSPPQKLQLSKIQDLERPENCHSQLLTGCLCAPVLTSAEENDVGVRKVCFPSRTETPRCACWSVLATDAPPCRVPEYEEVSQASRRPLP